jgi:hypothetical protein
VDALQVDVFVRVRPRNAEREPDEDAIVTADIEEHTITLMDPTGHPAVYGYDKVRRGLERAGRGKRPEGGGGH